MSSDYFFKKWKDTLARLEDVMEIDNNFSESKAHDKKLSEASERLAGMLGRYIAVFNEALECKQFNAQVQKVPFIDKVIRAISQRILELKGALRKLDGSNYQFLANGLKTYQLTPYDVEFAGIPNDAPRSETIDEKIKEIFKAVKEERERIILEKQKEETERLVNEKLVFAECWWITDDREEDDEQVMEEEEKETLTEEEIKTIEMAALIQAHERSRQVIYKNTQDKLKREKWTKELNGTLQPPARLELRAKAGRLIQFALRIYFEQKRKRVEECNRDDMLGLQYCKPPNHQFKLKSHELRSHWTELRKSYTKDWKLSCDVIKQKFLKDKGAEIIEDYRDIIREWFYTWYNEIKYFRDIPGAKEGGVVSVISDNIQSFNDWLEEYKKALEQQKANKGKTALELKFAEQEAKREIMRQKLEERFKMKQQAQLMRKVMKNPNEHPGYYYPKSNKLSHIIEVIEDYHKYWDDLDDTGTSNVKEKFVDQLDLSDACQEVKIELTDCVIGDMKEELQLLKSALKNDLMRMDEKMLEPLKRKAKKRMKKKRKPLHATMSENVADQLYNLVMNNILKEYPRITLDDFLGDHNLVGEDIRINYGQAFPHSGETRSVWWERCQEVVHGNHKVLIVGPKNSGKTTLVHALASLNDAVLFEIDPCEIPSSQISAAYLKPLVASVVKCAQVVQPSVIYVKNIHQLYYIKTPLEVADLDTHLLQKYLIRNLCKKLNKNDKVTVIGTCVDPWLTKAKLLKHFPDVVPVPDTVYSTVHKILYDWVTSNLSVPNDLEIQSLSYVLRGYTFGYIKDCLRNFLSPERIVYIGAYGLKPIDIYNYILDDNRETPVKYEKYTKWYFDKTAMGRKEKKHHEEQLQFKAALEKYAEVMKKKKKTK